MAIVETWKMRWEGGGFRATVRVNKDGMFRIKYPSGVSEKLGCEVEAVAKTKVEAEEIFRNQLEEYKTASTKTRKVILYHVGLMSGGSWDFFFARESDEIFGDLDSMKEMRDRLVELGIEGSIIFNMNRLIGYIETAHRLGDGMREIWKAVEWNDSGDHGIDQVRQATWRYNGEPHCEHEERTIPELTYRSWEEDGERRVGHVRHNYCVSCGADILLERDVKL